MIRAATSSMSARIWPRWTYKPVVIPYNTLPATVHKRTYLGPNFAASAIGNTVARMIPESYQLHTERTISIVGYIYMPMATNVASQILHLVKQSKDEPITIRINSCGGSPTASMAIHDLIRACPMPVSTWCIGEAHSFAALILASGTVGHRYCMPSATMALRMKPSVAKGKALFAEDAAIKFANEKSIVDNLYASYLRATTKEIDQMVMRNSLMTAMDAMKVGLVDYVSTNYSTHRRQIIARQSTL